MRWRIIGVNWIAYLKGRKQARLSKRIATGLAQENAFPFCGTQGRSISS